MTKAGVFVTLCSLIALLGLAVAAYPSLSRLVSSSKTAAEVSQITERASAASFEEVQAQLAAAREYNRLLQTPNSGTDRLREYYSVLNISDSAMGTVEIPKIDISLPIYHGTSDDVLERGAGHYDCTPLPIGEDNTASVLTTHSGLPQSRLFTDLEKLEVGDSFFITVLGIITEYTVDDIRVTLPNEVFDATAPPQDDKCYVSLVTCTPYRINSHRLIVRGVKSDQYSETESATSVRTQTIPADTHKADAIILALSASGFAALAALIIIFGRRKR